MGDTIRQIPIKRLYVSLMGGTCSQFLIRTVMEFVAIMEVDTIVSLLMVICLKQEMISVSKNRQFLMLGIQVHHLHQHQHQLVEAMELLACWVINVVVADAEVIFVLIPLRYLGQLQQRFEVLECLFYGNDFKISII